MLLARSHAVVTTVGSDRPGLVEAVSGWILRCGGNIEESRMAVLRGEFATIILVSGPSDLLLKLHGAQDEVEKALGLSVFVKEAQAEASAPQPVLRYSLRGTSLDQAGILHQVSQCLSRRGINIVSADTSTKPAPFSGALVFHFQMEVDIPANAPISLVRHDLVELGNRENVDLVLEAVHE